MKKKRVTYHLPIKLLNELKDISRSELPNVSKLVEELLEKWVEKRNSKKKVS